jgi:hypothetical protein
VTIIHRVLIDPDSSEKEVFMIVGAPQEHDYSSKKRVFWMNRDKSGPYE